MPAKRNTTARSLKKFSKNKRVKAVARERIGTPPPARTLEPKSVRKPKYKPNLLTAREE